MHNITDEIFDHVIKENRGFSNQEILKKFFKIDTDKRDMAKKIVEPLLKSDVRFKKHPDERWTAQKVKTIEEHLIADASFILFYIEDIERLKSKTLIKDNTFHAIDDFSSFFHYKGGNVDQIINIKDILEDSNRYIFIPYDHGSLTRLKKLYRLFSPLHPELKTLSIKQIIKALFPEKILKTWDDIIQEFNIVNLYSSLPISNVKTLNHLIDLLFDTVQKQGYKLVGDLIELSRQFLKKVDFSRYGFDPEFLKEIPEMPGVYLFYNRNGDVIYVGKTNNLKVRISSYFWTTEESPEKIEGILNQLYRIEYRITGSDLEAIVEEFRLIDLYRPAFNVRINIPQRNIEVSNKILILPSSMGGALKLYFLSNTIPLLEFNFDCSGDHQGLLEILKKINTSRGYVFDPLKVIAISYIKRYEENMNVIDIDRYGREEDILDALRLHCRALDEVFKEKSVFI